MMTLFHNRLEEQAFFNAELSPNRAALVILYGRRRTGKTSLLRKLAAERSSIFFVADVATRADQLRAFSQVVFEHFDEPSLSETAFPSWEAALRFVTSRTSSSTLLVIDEFPYLCQSDPSLPSVIQRLWDAEIRHTKLHIVLCGSYVSFMEKEILAAKNPLFGRRTATWLLEPLSFFDARAFFPHRSLDDQLRFFSVVGGIPAYLERFDPRRSLAHNVAQNVLRRGSPLYDEPRFLLMQELQDPRTYYSICRAVALGRTTPNEIAQGAGLTDRGSSSPYLQTLRDLRLLERRSPATERNPERTRRGRYRLADSFLRFWFRFVLPNTSALEAGQADRVWKSRVLPHLDQHISITFEDIACDHLWRLQRSGQLEAAYDRIGGWWRGGTEVDVVADSDEGPLLLGECKWSKRAVGTNVLDALVTKSESVIADRKGARPEVKFALWSRAGFTKDLVRRAKRDGVLLFDLNALKTVD